MHGTGGLLGRESEQRRVAEVIGAARNGHGSALLILGEPGVGKTALVDDASPGAGRLSCDWTGASRSRPCMACGHRLIADARLLIYPGRGHALPDTDRLHADLLAFIDS